MLPTKLSIEGLYSYKKRQEIDFSNLTEAGLFGIFGRVGSGKSSILEAMMLCIYGNTHRMNKSGDSRNFNLVNLGYPKLHLELEFQAADQKHYKGTYTIKKTKAGDKANSPNHSCYIKEGQDWLPISVGEMEQAVGMNHNHFSQVVIIPQNKFSKFLNQSSTDRTKMLKEIFNLHQYDLSQATKKLIQDCERELDELGARLDELAEYTEEHLENLQKEQTQLQSDKKRLQKAQEENQKQLAQMEQAAKSKEELDAISQTLAELENQKASMEKRRARLHQHRSLKNKLGKEAYQFNENKSKKKQNQDQLRLRQKALAQQEDRKQELEQQLKANEENRKQLPVWRKIAQELAELAEAKKEQKKLKELKNKIDQEEAQLAQLQKELQQDQRHKEALQSKLKATEEDLAHQETSEALKGLVPLFQDAQKKAKEAEETHKNQKQDLQNQRAYWAKKWDCSPTQLLDFQGYLKSIREQVRELETTINEHKNQLLTENLQEAAQQLAQQLHKGAPCPVCGSEEHPEPAQPEKAQKGKDLDKLEQEFNKLVVKQTAIEEAAQDMMRSETTCNQAEELSTRAKEELETQEKKLKNLGFEQVKEAVQFLEETKAKQQAAEELRKQLDRLSHGLDEKQSAYNEHQLKTRQSTSEYETRLAQLKKRKSHFTEVDPENYKQISIEQVHKMAKQKEEAIQNTEQQYEELSQEHVQQESQLSRLTEQVDHLLKDVQQLQKQEEELSNYLQQASRELGLASWEYAQPLLDEDLDEEAEEKTLSEFDKKLHSLSEQKARLDKQLEENPYDKEKHQQLQAGQKEQKTRWDEIQSRLGSLKDQIKKCQENMARSTRLKEEQSQKEQRLENLKVFKDMFRSEGFVKFVSGIFLESIMDNANQRFRKLTNGALQLKLAEDKSIEIVDLLNAGQTRNAKTLSGGQQFQAALCLALALGDSIREQASSKQRFFFLDEGFGTQDEQSLQTVLQSLRELSKEGRVVGVISHRQDVQERIEHHLHIENHQSTGSQIKMSWKS